MAFIDYVLQEPSCGWADKDGNLVISSLRQLWREAFTHINVFKSIRNWIPCINWVTTLCMVPFLFVFTVYYLTWPLVLLAVFFTA